MFCPNCGAENSVGVNYCRSCGLKLDAIIEAVADQLPSREDAGLQRRKEKFERAGLISLSIAGVIGLVLFVFFVYQYTNLGDVFVPVFAAIIAMIWLLLPGLGLLYYSKLFLKPKNRPQAGVPASTVVTGKLIEDRPFEPAPSSVTEDTTEFLNVPVAQRKE